MWENFPKFVLGFLVFSAVASLGMFAKEQAASLANLNRWAFLLTFAGVGLRVNIGEMRRLGFKPFVVGALAELSVTVATLGMVLAASLLLGL